MADESHDISIGGEVTATGMKAHIRSRFASAVDRFFGSKIDNKSVPIEAETAEAAAISAGRIKMIEALTEMGVQRLESDPEFAARAIESFLPSMFRKQENKDAVVQLALEDLASNTPVEAEGVSGPDALSDVFLNRFERYAEEATTDEVREKWGKVLAAEIRAPNTFSGKVLRIIDEIDTETAQIFERVAQHHIDGLLPKASIGELSFHEIKSLTTAELLVAPGSLGHVRFGKLTGSGGKNSVAWAFGNKAIVLNFASDRPTPNTNSIVLKQNGIGFDIPVYILTDVGRAITSILPDTSQAVLTAVAEKMAAEAPKCEVIEYTLVAAQWFPVRRHPSVAEV